jgi:hypothetical protein
MDNNMNLQYSGERLLRPEELLKLHGVNPDEWEVVRTTVSQHENKWQQWVRFMRKEIHPQWPVVQGVRVSQSYPSRHKRKPSEITTAVIIPDMHVGFIRQTNGNLIPLHNDRACFAVAGFIRETKPDMVVMLGDNLDLAEWSNKYLVTPDLAYTTQPSLEWFSSWLRGWRDYTGYVCYLEGNHDKRLRDALVANMRAACGLHQVDSDNPDPALSIPGLLDLHNLGVDWIGDYPRGEFWLNTNLCAMHAGALSNEPGRSAGKSLDGAAYSMLFGHAHRLESAHRTVWKNGKPHTYGSYCMGTLAHIDGRVPSNTARENWQTGFGVVHLYPDEKFHVIQVPIHDNMFYYNGREYHG